MALLNVGIACHQVELVQHSIMQVRVYFESCSTICRLYCEQQFIEIKIIIP